MGNPILEQMGRKNNIGNIVNALRGKSPLEAIDMMCNSNPAFKKFYTENKDRPIEDVCRSYNIDPDMIRQILGK